MRSPQGHCVLIPRIGHPPSPPSALEFQEICKTGQNAKHPFNSARAPQNWPCDPGMHIIPCARASHSSHFWWANVQISRPSVPQHFTYNALVNWYLIELNSHFNNNRTLDGSDVIGPVHLRASVKKQKYAKRGPYPCFDLFYIYAPYRPQISKNVGRALSGSQDIWSQKWNI